MAKKNIYHPVDEQALRGLLHAGNAGLAGVVLRLAWRGGLSREEIAGLAWEQVDFEAGLLRLKGRSVPLDPEVAESLAQWKNRCGGFSPWVAVSFLRRERVAPESLSRLARAALDAGGMKGVRLSDLRHAYVLRQIRELGWNGAARVCGMAPQPLRERYGPLAAAEADAAASEMENMATAEGNAAAGGAGESGALGTEEKLSRVMEQEKDSIAGLALRLCCNLGLSGRELSALRWKQVDFAGAVLRLEDRTLPLPEPVLEALQRGAQGRDPEDAVLSRRASGQSPGLPEISRMLHAALIRGGLEAMTLRQLREFSGSGAREGLLLEHVRARGSVTRGEVQALLSLRPPETLRLLRRMAASGQLTRVGARYYLAGTVCPPEDQRRAVLEYLAETGASYRQGIAEHLGIEKQQTSLLLRHMAEEGLIHCDRQRYYL